MVQVLHYEREIIVVDDCFTDGTRDYRRKFYKPDDVRFIGSESHRVLYYWHSIGNRFLTMMSNMFTNLNLSDMEVCYKVFKKELLEKIELQENRFGFEPEFTAKISRLGCPIYEVGISYYGRTYGEGKKINWKDGFRAIFVILKYGLLKR